MGPAQEDDGGDDDEAEEDGKDEGPDAARRGLVYFAFSSSQGLGIYRLGHGKIKFEIAFFIQRNNIFSFMEPLFCKLT